MGAGAGPVGVVGDGVGPPLHGPQPHCVTQAQSKFWRMNVQFPPQGQPGPGLGGEGLGLGEGDGDGEGLGDGAGAGDGGAAPWHSGSGRGQLTV